MAILAVFVPWGYYLGGHFHVIPYWQGEGKFRAATSGDYFLFVQISPSKPGRLGNAYVTGTAWLCTPRGQRTVLHLGGIMPKNSMVNSQGQPLHLYLDYRSFFTSTTDPRTRFDLYGTWGDRQITLDDHGSFANAFRPDGTPYLGKEHPPGVKPPVQVTLRETSGMYLSPSCPANP